MKEIKNNLINCKDCLYYGSCQKEEPCEYLYPVDEDAYAENLLEKLKLQTTPSPTSLLGAGKRDKRTSGSKIQTTYSYYRDMINGCLRDIRLGRTVYVYTECAVAEILRFEPDINLIYQDGVFYMSL